MKLAIVSAFAVALSLIASPVAADLCSNVPTTGANVITWTGHCTDFNNMTNQDNCWSGTVTPQSTAVFPDKSIVTWVTLSDTFITFNVTNVVIQEGATVTMTGGAIQTTGCLLVQGTLALSGAPQNQAPFFNYLPDPGQPEGTDCLKVQAGFTPRVCGPGMLKVQGTLNLYNQWMSSQYASVFQSGLIDTTGTLNSNGGFVWGNITVNGQYITSGYSYQHGYLYNYGTTNLTTIAFDVWTEVVLTSTMPLLIENHGTVNLVDGSEMVTTESVYAPGGTFRAVLVNFANTAFYGYGGMSQYEFDVFNYGTLAWNYQNFGSFWGGGTFVNKGAIVVNGANVYLSTFHSIGGSIQLNDGGNINFGSSSTSASATMKLCQLTQGMDSNLLRKFELNSKRRNLAARHVGHNEPVIEQRGDCWWYGDFCYHSPYLWSPPVDVDAVTDVKPEQAVTTSGLPVQRHGGTVRLIVQNLIAESELSLDTPCNVRYSFEKTSVSGDGSGSVIATLPVKVIGSLTLGTGTKWYIATERRGLPFYGGGKVIVGRHATLFAGINADFKNDGVMEVLRGGKLAVPRHADVLLSNFTVMMRPGSTLHVDGKLTIAEAKGAHVQVDACGLLAGTGDVVMEKDGMLGCSAEARKHKLTGLRLPRRH